MTDNQHSNDNWVQVFPSRRRRTYLVKAVSPNEAVLKVFTTSGDTVEISYWRPSAGGYVFESTGAPSTWGTQVCEGLSHYGNTLRCPVGVDLADLIRREARSAKGRSTIEALR